MITDKSQAKEGGFAQVRAALTKFKGTVVSTDSGQWGGQLVDPETGKKKPPREYFEINFTDVEVLESTEVISMDISEEFSVRLNCSDFKGSFWIDMFLASADKFKLLIPDGLVGKRLTMEKTVLEAFDKAGNAKPEYNSTGYVIVGVEESGGAKPAKVKPAPQPSGGVMSLVADPMGLVADLADGKTDAELKKAILEHPGLVGSPVLPLAKAGMLTQVLINEGKLALVDGKYQKP